MSSCTTSTGNFIAKYVSGDANGNGKLDYGEVWLFTSAGVAPLTLGVGTFKDTATVTGTNGSPLSASDDAYVTGAPTQLVLVKAINAFDPAHPSYFEDANTAPGQYLPVGSTVTFTFAVSAVGLSSVSNVAVTDSPAMTIAPVTQGERQERRRRSTTTACSIRARSGSSSRPARWLSGLHTDTGTATGKDTLTNATLTATRHGQLHGRDRPGSRSSSRSTASTRTTRRIRT